MSVRTPLISGMKECSLGANALERLDVGSRIVRGPWRRPMGWPPARPGRPDRRNEPEMSRHDATGGSRATSG